jgi:hypothetical protein
MPNPPSPHTTAPIPSDQMPIPARKPLTVKQFLRMQSAEADEVRAWLKEWTGISIYRNCLAGQSVCTGIADNLRLCNSQRFRQR